MESKNKEKLAFLFPGQGAQYVGMGKYLYDEHEGSRELFHKADDVLGFKLSEIILNGPEEKLKETEITQPSLLVVSVATAKFLKEKGVHPTIMAGHSLGEYSALVVADAMRFEDAVKLVNLRGRFMQAAVPMGEGTMAAVLALDDHTVTELCEKVSNEMSRVVEPAAYNCPGQVVVAGHIDAVDKLSELAKAEGGKVRQLKVSAPFHCSLLKPAAEQLAKELAKIEVNDPAVPYVANVDASIISAANSIVPRLTDQVCQPVRWTQSLMNILLMRTQRFIEVGPGKVSVGHLKKVDRRKTERAAVFAVTDRETDIQEVLELFG